MKNKFWLENLKSMIAMGVVGVIVLGLLYWKFFMDTGPPPPQYYMPPPPPPPPPAADAGGNTSFHPKRDQFETGFMTLALYIKGSENEVLY